MVAILEEGISCVLGLSDSNLPYLVPMCYGYREEQLFLHSANAGRKLEILRQNPHVCFLVETSLELVENEDLCEWGMHYRTVIGNGKARILETHSEKQEGLDVITLHYAKKKQEYPPLLLEKIAVIRIDIETMTGRRS